MGWYGEELLNKEKDYRLVNLEKFRRSQRNMTDLKDYWTAKPWLSKAVKKRLEAFFEEIGPQLRTLKFNMDLNVIPLTLVYLAWADEVPDNSKLVQFARERSPRDWKRVRRTLRQARREIKNNILPFFKMKGGWDRLINRLSVTMKDLAFLENPVMVLENQWEFFGEGQKRKGKLPNRIENNVLMCLSDYFKLKTGAAKYDLVAEIFGAAFQRGSDKPGVIRRLKTHLSSDYGLIDGDERVDVSYLEAVRETWRHILEEAGSWDGPIRRPIQMPRELSKRRSVSA